MDVQQVAAGVLVGVCGVYLVWTLAPQGFRNWVIGVLPQRLTCNWDKTQAGGCHCSGCDHAVRKPGGAQTVHWTKRVR